MWAASERHAPVVKLLLERGADWKIRGFDRETKPPKLSAASAISPIPRGGFTALMFTAREGDLESARIMLDAGVDVNWGDVDNVTPLVAAMMKSSTRWRSSSSTAVPTSTSSMPAAGPRSTR